MNKFILILFNAMIILGCASNQVHRTQTHLCSISESSKEKKEKDEKVCSESSLQKVEYIPESEKEKTTSNYLIGVVEFDDQGQFYDRRQLKELLTILKEEAKKNNLIIVTFVHGWHHNAKEDDSNFKSFKELLQEINNLELKNPSEKKRKIVGVYLGWRGDISVPYLDFWNRKDAAETVGTSGGVTETLLELEKIVKPVSVKDGAKEGENRLVIIGHSFGGLIVYSALAHILLDRFISGSSIIDGVGNLIVLVNPAFEASRFANLYQLMEDKEEKKKIDIKKDDEQQPPLMVVLNSKEDDATKHLFPIAQYVSVLFGFSDKDELFGKDKSSVFETVGNFKYFINSELKQNIKSQRTDCSQKQVQEILKEWNESKDCVEGKEYSTLYFPGTELKRKCSDLQCPYLVIKVDGDIIPNHSDIWGSSAKKVLPFLQCLILMQTINDSAIVDRVREEQKHFHSEREEKSERKACSKNEEIPIFNCPTWKRQRPVSFNEKMIESRKWEVSGFLQLTTEDWKCAEQSFQNAYEIWPTYHNVDEILKLIKEVNRENKENKSCYLYKEITGKYSWGIPKEFKEDFSKYIKEHCT